MQRPVYTWMAFLAMAFAVVGLVGIFGTFAAPLPLERAMGREDALDAAEAAAHGAHPAEALEALRPRLDDSADTLLPKASARGVPMSDADIPAGFDARIAAERVAMRARLLAEADAVATRMRVMIGIVTVMGAVFGGIMLRLASNTAP